MNDYLWLKVIGCFTLGTLVWGFGYASGVNRVHNQLIAADLAYYSVDAKSGITKLIIRGIP